MLEKTRTWRDFQVDVPEGTSGPWIVQRFTVDEDAARLNDMRQTFAGFGYRSVPVGTYTRLLCGETTVMSDTPAEIRDLYPFFRRARGRILVNGLGLGVALNGVLAIPEVEHVTVIEQSPDVIALVEPTWRAKWGDRFTIIQADAMTWQPPKGIRYAVIWHDIWNDLSLDNLPSMATLNRRYGRRCDWQGCWGKDDVERIRQNERRYSWR